MRAEAEAAVEEVAGDADAAGDLLVPREIYWDYMCIR